MAYQSKYTGLQIDDILDSVEYKQSKIEDLASIRAGAQKGATALQSYTEKYTGTVTGIKINGVVKSGSGVIDLGTIESKTLTESDIAAMGFTKNTGTYSKPSGGIPKSDLASAVQTSLGKADTALQSYTEQYKGTVTGIKINGTTKNPSSGVVDLGTVITAHQDISGKQDKLVSGTNIKTINGESILGSGNIEIESGGESFWYNEVGNLTTDYPVTFSYAATFANGIEASTSTPDGSISKGLAGQVLTTNGERCYWATPTSGGSGGGSSAYSEVNHGTSDTTFALTPNTFHVWDEVSALTLTLGSETSGVANEYLFQFTSGSTATTLSLPSDLKWAEELVIEPNMIYQVSILKGLASVLEFSNVQLISFILNGTTYTALQGMTWIDWCNSSYNINGARVNGNFIYAGAGVIIYNNATVLPSEVIINNRQYIIAV